MRLFSLWSEDVQYELPFSTQSNVCISPCFLSFQPQFLAGSWVVLVVKNPLANVGDARDAGSIPGPGRSPGGGNGNPLRILAWKAPWAEKPGGLLSTGPQRAGHDSTVGGQWQNLSKYRNLSPYCHRASSINFPSAHKMICGYLHIFSDSNPNFCLSPSFCQNNSLTDELKQ